VGPTRDPLFLLNQNILLHFFFVDFAWAWHFEEIFFNGLPN